LKIGQQSIDKVRGRNIVAPFSGHCVEHKMFIKNKNRHIASTSTRWHFAFGAMLL